MIFSFCSVFRHGNPKPALTSCVLDAGSPVDHRQANPGSTGAGLPDDGT